MGKNKTNSLLEDHVRKLLLRIEELEKVELDLKVHGQSSRGLERLKADYRRLLNACFDYVEWRDPG